MYILFREQTKLICGAILKEILYEKLHLLSFRNLLLLALVFCGDFAGDMIYQFRDTNISRYYFQRKNCCCINDTN